MYMRIQVKYVSATYHSSGLECPGCVRYFRQLGRLGVLGARGPGSSDTTGNSHPALVDICPTVSIGRGYLPKSCLLLLCLIRTILEAR